MRTTIEVPDPLFREVKTRAVQQGVTLKELISKYIEAGLRGQPTAAVTSRKRFPLPVAILRETGRPLTAALTNRELGELLDEQDLGSENRSASIQASES